MVESTYTAEHLHVLEGLAAVRKRPGMYIGSTDTKGLTHCLYEIIDNSADEASAGFCTKVTIDIFPDGSAQVIDNGRGIPVDTNLHTGLSGVEMVLTKLHAGGKFGDSAYGSSGGLHGVGAAAVNALSDKLQVQVTRDGGVWEQEFHHGMPVKDLAQTSTAGPRKHGTTVRFWPDRDLFTPDADFDIETLKTRMYHLTHLIPGLAVALTDQRNGEVVVYEFEATGGLVDLVNGMVKEEQAVGEALVIKGSGSFTERIPVIGDDGTRIEDVKRTVEVEIALRWTMQDMSIVHSYVNTITTPHGGTHRTGMERGLMKAVAGQLKTTDPVLTKDDVLDGLAGAICVRFPEPQFEGQTKEILGTRDIGPIVAEVVEKFMTAWLTARRNKVAAKLLMEKLTLAAKSRLAAKEAREAKRKRNTITNTTLPAKLVDCRSRDADRNEIFIVEGDSALGTFKKARNSEFQAALPIRGKILNVARASEKQMLANAECAAIVSVLGAGSGNAFNVDNLRYGRLIVLADADVDGAHIRCLLLTLAYRYFRPMLETGHVYAAVPPLHRVAARKGRTKETFYTYDDEELQLLLADLRKKGYTWDEAGIQRYKGLGEMDEDQLAETTLDPTKRHLRRVTVPDAAAAARLFELCMGSDATARREYIISKAPELNPDMVDA